MLWSWHKKASCGLYCQWECSFPTRCKGQSRKPRPVAIGRGFSYTAHMCIIPVILCGGAGSRLWPLSRGMHPKQFMDLGGRTLFGDTLDRLRAIPAAQAPLVVSNREQRFLVAGQMQEHGFAPAGRVLLEPLGRNTAAAIAAAALAVQAKNPGSAMLVMPSDHAMSDPGSFAGAVAQAMPAAREGALVTFGVRPTGPETGYGYIRRGEARGDAFLVDAFVEKPDLASAEAMLKAGGHYWNSGIFMFLPDAFLAELERLAPEILRQVQAAWEQRETQRDFVWLGDEFAASPAVSVDYAVMEKTPLAVVLPMDAGWTDLGSWRSVQEAGSPDSDGNVCVGDVLAEDVRGSYLHSSGRLVAALGLENLVVVETGDAVLVADRDRSQDVRRLVERLAALERTEKDLHLRVFRPWGWYESLARGPAFQVKRIMVKSGASLSLQLHHHRAEHWVVVSGSARVTMGESQIILSANQSVYIPVGMRHRLVNEEAGDLEIIEVQSGSYLGEDDIVRFEDSYGRN